MSKIAAPKTATLTLRIEPAVKERLRTMAERERRSLANMIEVMILDYCQREGIPGLETDSRGSGGMENQ